MPHLAGQLLTFRYVFPMKYGHISNGVHWHSESSNRAQLVKGILTGQSLFWLRIGVGLLEVAPQETLRYNLNPERASSLFSY